MNRSFCDEVAEQDLAERYLAGTLSAEEEERFETHYLTCERCREEVRFARALREAAVSAGASVAPDPVRHRRSWSAWGIVLAAAAVVATILLVRSRSSEDEWARLGGVIEPPVYLGAPLRSEDLPADSLFRSAMRAYSAGRFDEAADGLRAALDAGVDPPAAEFFLASSRLMLDQPEEAADGYRRVIAAGDTPYQPEARLYLSKALLRAGRMDEALSELRAVASGDSEVASWAAALADSVEAARGP